jgi:hypothetical protein
VGSIHEVDDGGDESWSCLWIPTGSESDWFLKNGIEISHFSFLVYEKE